MNKKTPKSRFHKQLFTKDSPYGHKVQKDKTKIIPRKQKRAEVITYPDGADIDQNRGIGEGFSPCKRFM